MRPLSTVGVVGALEILNYYYCYRAMGGLCCGPVSVRLSVTFVHSTQTAEDIVKLLYRPSSPSAGTQFQANRFSGDAKCTGVGTLCDFRLKSPYISEMVRDRLMITMKR